MSNNSSQFCGRTRREHLWDWGAGFAGLALSGMLQRDGFYQETLGAESSPGSFDDPLAPRIAHLPNRAKHCIFLYMYGGPSQMDLFDYKPELQKRDGQKIKMEIRRREMRESTLLGSKRKFKQHGESGQWCSDAFPHTSKHMDKLAVIKSLYMDSFAHGSANLQMNCGRIIQGSPSIGSWLTYGLGTLNENLPGYVVMLDPRGGPIPGSPNWAAGYMPAAYQGTVFRTGGEPILNLESATNMTPKMRREQIEAINALNNAHLESRPGLLELQARIASYELAFQLQSSAPEALDLSQETRKTKEMYGLYDPKPNHKLAVGPAPFARQCLIARRLVERGVRFRANLSRWGPSAAELGRPPCVEENLAIHCPEIDRPIDGLLSDLEQRGLLDETLVIWGGEFGRQPVSQGNNGGRDHNPKGFTYWMAGKGVKGGTSYGETDDLGHEAVVDRHHVRDLHATILHLMGLDHKKLTYFYGGLDQKLTGVVEAHPIKGVMS